ncbi:MAG TPA: hypothetical protein VI411_08820, partial [Actinomycetota bacterium]
MRMAGRALALLATGMLLLASGSSLGPTIAEAQGAPTLEVDPSSGGVGTTVQIAGRGFCGSPACSSVRVSFAGIVVADGIGVGTDGRFAQSVTVPGGIPAGEKAVAATQTNASGEGREAIATFQVTLGGATASPASTATPTGSPTPSATGSPTTSVPPATTVIVPPAASGGGSSSGLTWAMVVAGAVFLAALLGMAYVLWRSRSVPAPLPPQVGPIAPYEEVVAALTPHGKP